MKLQYARNVGALKITGLDVSNSIFSSSYQTYAIIWKRQREAIISFSGSVRSFSTHYQSLYAQIRGERDRYYERLRITLTAYKNSGRG